MRERSLVAFTLLAQTAVGMFWVLAAAWWTGDAWPPPSGAQGGVPLLTPMLAVGPILAAAQALSLLHLGTPRNAWRALANLKRSWLSREILFLALFGGGWAGWVAFVRIAPAPSAGPAEAPLAALAAVVAALGVGLVHSMGRVYRIRTVPAWDTPLTPLTFFLTAGSLGGSSAALAVALVADASAAVHGPIVIAGLCVAAELALEPVWRARRRRAAAEVDPGLDGERARAAANPMLRPILLLVALASFAVALAGAGRTAPLGTALAAAAWAAVIGRVAFYGSHARRGL